MKATQKPLPMVAAYAVAERLAAEHARDWIITGDVDGCARMEGCSAVFEALTVGPRKPHAQDTLNAIITKHIADQAIASQASDTLSILFTDSLDAGYLYGVAMGLTLAKSGGPR